MKPEEFNRRCAEYMGIEVVQTCKGWRMRNPDKYDRPKYFSLPDYCHNANDRNKVIEKMEITTAYRSALANSDIQWACHTFKSDIYADKSMEAAQIACITKVLEAL